MLRITQKYFNDDGKIIAYCDVKYFDGLYDYNIKPDEKSKKRFNNYLRKLGFVVGSVSEIPPEKILEI